MPSNCNWAGSEWPCRPQWHRRWPGPADRLFVWLLAGVAWVWLLCERALGECPRLVDGQGQPLLGADGYHVLDEVVLVLGGHLQRGFLPVEDLAVGGELAHQIVLGGHVF